jgi:hypothetical protein
MIIKNKIKKGMGVKMRFIIVLSALIASSMLFSQQNNESYLMYIEQYHGLAQQQQKEYGIPTSITLAQGLLESGAGKGFLSTSSNNHFGIKCSDWEGEKVYYDDDQRGECFRKYNRVVDSYEDHSLFLVKRPRYASLFNLKQTDYEGWAFGLKSAGYATDPTYAYKLISIIEGYELHRFDLEQSGVNATKIKADNNTNSIYDNQTVPKETTVEVAHKEYLGKVSSYAAHEVKKVNGVLFVTSSGSDTYASIGDEFELSDERIRRYNDVGQTARLLPGKRVFIAAKKHKAPKECLTHRICSGETMLTVSQDYGVKVVDLYRLNAMGFDQGAVYGRVLKLR